MKREPSVKEKTLQEKMDETEEKFFMDLVSSIDNDKSDRQQWEYKMITAANQRLGVKRASNYPYEDAPDIPLPESDKLIKKATPNLVLSTWSPKNMAIVSVAQGIEDTPELKQKAHKSQLALNMVLRKKMDLFSKLEIAADYAKEKGHCIFKVIEEYQSRIICKTVDLTEYPEEQIAQLKALPDADLKNFIYARYPEFDKEDEKDQKTCDDIVKQIRKGEDIIEFEVEEITSYPNIEVPDPLNVIVPSYTRSLEEANRIAEDYILTKHEMWERMDQGIFLKQDLEDLTPSNENNEAQDGIIEQNKKWNRGISTGSNETDVYRCRDVYCWKQEEEDGPFYRWVYTYLVGVGNPEQALLRRTRYPFEFRDWNFNRWDNEVKGDNHYESRGIPEQIRAIQEMMERSMNNMLIRDEMNNMPLWEVLDTSEILQRDQTFKPGSMIPVTALGQEIKAMTGPANVDFSSDRVMQLLKAYAEEYMGNVDQLFRNASNAGGGKTLGEIKEGIRQTSGPINVDVIRWNEVMSKVYSKVFEVLRDRTGENLVIDGVTITKEDFNFPAEVKANGTLEISDKDLATSKALNRIMMALQMKQNGVADTQDVYNSYVDWLEKDGVKDPDDFATNPEEILKSAIAQLEQQAQQLSQQVGQLTEIKGEGEKEVAKLKEKASKELNSFKGRIEANAETKATGNFTKAQ